MVRPLYLFLLNAVLLSPGVGTAATITPAHPAATTSTAEAAVLKEFHALSAGDADELAAVFAPEFAMHDLPTEELAVVGPRSDSLRQREPLRAHFKQAFATKPRAQYRVVHMVSLGELVVARVAIQSAADTPPDHALTAFRVRNGLIGGVWQIAREVGADRQSGVAAQAVIRRFAEAADRGDVETFLSLFSPDARNFHFRRDPESLGGGPSQSLTDQSSRERVFREMFAKPRVGIAIVDSVALGEWVVSRDQATRPDGTVLDELSIYRVRDRRIIADWYVAEAAHQ